MKKNEAFVTEISIFLNIVICPTWYLMNNNNC